MGSNDAHWYGWDCGFGYCMYYRVWVHEMNRWQNVIKIRLINGTTISHLVGLPNHPRAWTRECYHLIGGHREELLVADDYDFLVRTFLSTKYVAIPDLLYIQYRNENGDNSTFHRNNQIQILVKELYNYYLPRINDKITRTWNYQSKYPIVEYGRGKMDDPGRKSAHIIHENSSKVSYSFPIPYSHTEREYSQLFHTFKKGWKTTLKTLKLLLLDMFLKKLKLLQLKHLWEQFDGGRWSQMIL